MSEHTPSVKPWEWATVPQVWREWALTYHNVRVAVEKGAQKTND